MAFARGVDHLDGDELSIPEFVVPHPNSSAIFRVKDDRMTQYAILRGDVAIIERGHPLKAGRIALVNVDGDTRLVHVLRDGSRVMFEGLDDTATNLVLLGTASRIIRPLLP